MIHLFAVAVSKKHLKKKKGGFTFENWSRQMSWSSSRSVLLQTFSSETLSFNERTELSLISKRQSLEVFYHLTCCHLSQCSADVRAIKRAACLSDLLWKWNCPIGTSYKDPKRREREKKKVREVTSFSCHLISNIRAYGQKKWHTAVLIFPFSLVMLSLWCRLAKGLAAPQDSR